MPPSPDEKKRSRIFVIVAAVVSSFAIIPIGCTMLAAFLRITRPIDDERYMLLRPSDALFSIFAWSSWVLSQVILWIWYLYKDGIVAIPWRIVTLVVTFIILGLFLRLLFDFAARVAAKSTKK